MSKHAPDEWSKQSFSEVCFFQEGPGLRNWQYTESGYPFLNIRCIKEGYLDLTNVQYISWDEAQSKYQHFFLEEGDYVLSSSGTIGRMAQVKKSDLPLMLNTSVIRFRSTNEEKLDTGFLPHYLQSREFIDQITRESQGSAQANFGPTHLKLVTATLPPRSQQQKIASILTSVDQVIAQTEGRIGKLHDLKTGMMQELLTKGIGHTEFVDSPIGRTPKAWDVVPIENVTDQIIDFRGRTPKKLKMEWGDGTIRALSANNVQMGRINFDKECYFGSDALYEAWMTKGDVAKGDIVFTMEAPLGNVAIVPDDHKYILSQRVILLKPDRKKVTNQFLYQCMMSENFRSQLVENSTGTTATGIQQKRLIKLLVPVPSLKEQERLASSLSSADNRIDLTRRKLESLRKLKSALMHDLLSGKVRVTVN